MRKKIIAIISLVLLLPATVAFSQSPIHRATSTQVAWPSSPMGTSIGPDTLFHTFIQYVYEWGISLGGIAVFVMLLWAGIQYLTSAGDPGKMGSAIKRIQSSVLGLVLLLTSWLILNTINPQLVQLNQLPDLWPKNELAPIEMLDPAESAPPCDFIVVYPRVDYRGTSGEPIKFTKESEATSEVQEIIKIEGNTLLNVHSEPWASAKGFIKVTTEEMNLINDKKLDIVLYNENGGLNVGPFEYKEGGLCMIDLFYTTRRWFNSDPCGGRLARSQLPVRDFTEMKFSDQAITCAEATRTIPKSYRLE